MCSLCIDNYLCNVIVNTNKNYTGLDIFRSGSQGIPTTIRLLPIINFLNIVIYVVTLRLHWIRTPAGVKRDRSTVSSFQIWKQRLS